jgi:hypothetical protein
MKKKCDISFEAGGKFQYDFCIDFGLQRGLYILELHEGVFYRIGKLASAICVSRFSPNGRETKKESCLG